MKFGGENHNLLLDGLVPPKVCDEHVVGRDQIEARAATLDAHLHSGCEILGELTKTL